MTLANPATDLTANVGLAAWRRPVAEPWLMRPDTTGKSVAIGTAARLLSGPIGGWRVWRTEAAPGAGPGFVSAVLPRAKVRSDPARISVSGHGRFAIRPALALSIGRSLLESATPFSAGEVAAAIGSTHPAALVLAPRRDDGSSAGASLAAADGRGVERLGGGTSACTDLILGQEATPGIPEPGMTELRIATWRSWKRSRVVQTVPIADLTAPLTWLANQGLANQGASGCGGLLVGQLVVFDLAPEEIWIDSGIWTKLVIGAFGMVEFCLEPRES